MKSIFIYLSVFVTSCIALNMLQARQGISKNCKSICIYHEMNTYIFLGIFFTVPIITLYSLRDGVGTDFYSYQIDYLRYQEITIKEYASKHFSGDSEYYCEIGFFLLNKIAPSYVGLQFIVAFLMCFLIFKSVTNIKDKYSHPLSLYIFLCLNFSYSMNGIRYVVALSFILLGYTYLSQNRIKYFVVCVICASLFHKSSLICLPFILLKNFNSNKINRIRDILVLGFIFSFPLLVELLLTMASYIPVFERYFNSAIYSLNKSDISSKRWLLHIIPVLIPILFFSKNKIRQSRQYKTMFLIYLLEFPFRNIGLYNEWYGRLARIPQVIEMLLVPIKSVKNKNSRVVLLIYFICWYTFYFIYYGMDTVVPYQWIL